MIMVVGIFGDGELVMKASGGVVAMVKDATLRCLTNSDCVYSCISGVRGNKFSNIGLWRSTFQQIHCLLMVSESDH